jgi:hypothetical protein
MMLYFLAILYSISFNFKAMLYSITAVGKTLNRGRIAFTPSWSHDTSYLSCLLLAVAWDKAEGTTVDTSAIVWSIVCRHSH